MPKPRRSSDFDVMHELGGTLELPVPAPSAGAANATAACCPGPLPDFYFIGLLSALGAPASAAVASVLAFRSTNQATQIFFSLLMFNAFENL